MKSFARPAGLLRLIVVVALFAAANSLSFAKEIKLTYLAPGQPDSTVILAPPPLPGSAEQDADMAEVVAIQKACTTNEATVAHGEKKFSVFNFTPAIGDFAKPDQFPRTLAFFQG